MERNELIDITVESVLKSKKYRYIYGPTVRRVVERLVDRYKPKELEKSVKRELHRIWGSFFTRPDFDRLLDKVREQKSQEESVGKNLDELLIINQFLLLQTSTMERIEILDDFYKEIYEITGVPSKIVEYGCGINALTYPWMGSGVKYTGYDIDTELIDFINDFYKLFGFDNRAEVRLGDVLLMDFEDSDISFLFKLLPLLEKQEKGSGLEVLKSIKSKYIVVSYPTESISGKSVGMESNYRDSFYNLIKNEDWNIDEIVFKNELVFVVGK